MRGVKSQLLTIICKHCGISFTLREAQVKKCRSGERKFCSVACFQASSSAIGFRSRGVSKSNEWKIKVSAILSGLPEASFWNGGLWGNKEYVSWKKNERWRKLRANGGSHTFDEWVELKKRSKMSCVYCLKTEPKIKLVKDHILPVSRGGSDDIENIQPLCRGCNAKKYNKLEEKLHVIMY